jgi:flagellar basal body rod protein FlgC
MLLEKTLFAWGYVAYPNVNVLGEVSIMEA